MKTKIKCLLMAVLTLSFMYSCSKKALKNVEVDSQWNLALFNDNITINELLERADSSSVSWLVVNEDGRMSAFYSNPLGVVLRGSDLLSELPSIEYQDTIIFGNKGEQIVVPVVFDNFIVDRATLKSGSLNISVDNNLPFGNAHVTLTSANILADNNPLVFSLDLKAGKPSSVTVDLADCVLVFDGENTDMVFDLDASVGSKDLNVELSFDLNICNLAIKELEGSLKEIKTEFGNNENIDFGIEKLSGSMVISPKLYLEYKNSFGIEAVAVVDTFGFEKENGELYNLITGDSAYLTIRENVLEYHSSEIQDIVNQVDIESDYCKFDVNGYVSIGSSRGNVIVSDESNIDVIGNVELPLEFTANDLCYRDTVEMDFGDVESIDMLDEVGFHIIINNKLPITITPQLYLLDPDDGSIALSIVPEGSEATGSYDGVPVKSIIDIQIPKDDFDKLFNAKKLMIVCTVDTEGNYVKLTKDQYFGMSIGLILHSSSISLDSDK